MLHHVLAEKMYLSVLKSCLSTIREDEQFQRCFIQNAN